MKILAVGDVVGRAAVQYLKEHLRRQIRALGADLTVVNGENAADIRGISRDDAEALFDAGADVITGGNHSFGQRDVYRMLDDEKRLLRPANFPGAAPGHGSVTVTAAGQRVLVINLQGNVGMNTALTSPFSAADGILRAERGKYDLAVVDFHAEATSEKQALGLYLDGRAVCVFGTHTHVRTDDGHILPGGTGYITDIGMTGPENGILGAAAQPVLDGFLTAMPQRFAVADGPIRARGVLFTLSGARCTEVRPVTF